MNLKYSVGIDVSSKKIDVCLSRIDDKQSVKVVSSKKFTNGLSGFLKLEEWIEKNHKEKEISLVICMEATGVYHENCAFYFHQKGYKISIILPNKAKHYLISLGLKSKNDRIDAKGLSRMGAEQCLELWEPMGIFFYKLRQYTRQYQNLQEQKTVFKNQLHAFEHSMYDNSEMMEYQKNIILLIDSQLKGIKESIKKHLDSDPIIKQKVEGICKIKGISTLSLGTILAETNGFSLFKNYKQLVSFAGFDVVENESGNSRGRTRISKKGNGRIRRALFMPAFTAVKHNEKPLSNLFHRTYEKHGIKLKSYVAVQKKLLVLVYHLWKKDQAYDPLYNQMKYNSPKQVEATTDKLTFLEEKKLSII